MSEIIVEKFVRADISKDTLDIYIDPAADTDALSMRLTGFLATAQRRVPEPQND